MSTSLTNALLDQDTGGIYRRHDIQVMDTSSTSLPSPSSTAPTVDGVVLNPGDKAMFTALTVGANAVYTLHLDTVNGQPQYSFPAVTDHRYTSDARGPQGSPTNHDIMRVLEGSHADQLVMWDTSSWTTPDIADGSTAAAAIADTAAATDAQTPSTIMKRDSTGATSIASKSGATGSRPVVTTAGYMYFDTDLGQPIWWDGTQYVDATGTPA